MIILQATDVIYATYGRSSSVFSQRQNRVCQLSLTLRHTKEEVDGLPLLRPQKHQWNWANRQAGKKKLGTTSKVIAKTQLLQTENFPYKETQTSQKSVQLHCHKKLRSIQFHNIQGKADRDIQSNDSLTASLNS